MGLKKAYDELEITDGPLELNSNNITNVGSVESELINSEQASVDNTFKTARNDSELDELQPVDSGTKVILGATEFSDTREFTNRVHIVGTRNGGQGTRISSNWTINNRHSTIENIWVQDGVELILGSSDYIMCTNVDVGGIIRIEGDWATLGHISHAGEIIFESGTSGGVVGARTGQINVTDNGTNNIMPLS